MFAHCRPWLPIASNMTTDMKFVPRRSEERGHADHGWLKTFHTFSFAIQQHELFGPLRVINEDRVAPRTGFGTHSHREFESFRGDVQLTSAGTGISHSEKTHGAKQVHFLQIWSYHQRRASLLNISRAISPMQRRRTSGRASSRPSARKGVLPVREGEGPAPVQSPLTLYATLLGPGKSLARPLEGKKGYIHVVQTSGYNEGPAKGATLTLREGDGAYIFVGKAGNSLVILVFDLD
ncbi:RmlC-like cupin domain-containing protein [Pholiota molesta]|nr:RmlC-like cupin domain-containing protein [Pholiota molesta]